MRIRSSRRGAGRVNSGRPPCPYVGGHPLSWLVTKSAKVYAARCTVHCWILWHDDAAAQCELTSLGCLSHVEGGQPIRDRNRLIGSAPGTRGLFMCFDFPGWAVCCRVARLRSEHRIVKRDLLVGVQPSFRCGGDHCEWHSRARFCQPHNHGMVASEDEASTCEAGMGMPVQRTSVTALTRTPVSSSAMKTFCSIP